VARFGVPLSALGMDAPAPFGYYVVHRGLNEDWLHTPRTDVVPDGGDAPGGPRLGLDPTAPAYVPDDWSLEVPADGKSVVGLRTGPGSREHAFLALFPSNQHEWPGAQATVMEPGSGPGPVPGPRPVYLPLALRNHRILDVPSPNVLVREALDALSEVDRLRMTYDLTDRVDPNQDGQRYYTFDGAGDMQMVTSYRSGSMSGRRIEYRRWGPEAFYKEVGDPGRWHCYAGDRHTLVWPEMTARLRREFPASDWWYNDPPTGQSAGGRPTWRLRRTLPGGQGESFMEVEDASRLPQRMSWTEGAGPLPVRSHVYWPKDFDDPTILVGGRPPSTCP
jgi:hypothetical protein